MPEVITDNLGLWSSALLTKSTAGRGSNGKLEAYGIKKLRALILELAVRGKLVPQDPNDEPASELLKRIAAEKARLNLGSRIHGSEVLLQESTDRELPRGWVSVAASALFPTRSGNSKLIKGKQHARPKDGLFPGYSASGQDVWLDDWEYEGVAIILSAVGARCGKAFLAKGKWSAVANTHIIWVMPNITLPEFAMLHLNNEAFWTRSGGAQPFVKVGETLDRPLRLPPLAEQHRIVAKVDELMALCDQLEQQQTDSIAAHQTLVASLLGTLTRVESQQKFSAAWTRIASHFDTLFTTEASIDQLKQTLLQLAVAGKLSSAVVSDKPISTLLEEIMIERKRVGATKKELEYFEEECQEAKKSIAKNRVMLKTRFFCAFITKGTTPASTELLQTGEIPFLKVYNIVSNRVDFDYKPTFISKEVHESKLKRSVLFPGDVIMNIVGPPLGKVAIVPEQYPEWNMNQALAVFRPMGDIYNRYLFYMLSSETVLKTVLADVRGTAGQDNLSLEQCRDLLVPIPSVEEQHRIVAKVDELMALCDALKARLADAQNTQIHLADAIVEQAVC